MKRNSSFSLGMVLVCLLVAGCHMAGRSCPAPGATAAPYANGAYGVPQGSGGGPQPAYQAPVFQGSGSR